MQEKFQLEFSMFHFKLNLFKEVFTVHTSKKLERLLLKLESKYFNILYRSLLILF